MGNDGGTIAKGRDLKAIYGTEKKDGFKLDDQKQSLLSVCALTSLPLYDDGPQKVVSDYKGLLYLKEKAIEAILDAKTGKQKRLPHIKGLDDLLELSIAWNDGAMVCPLTKQSESVYAYLRPCGCVMGSKILSELRLALKVKEDVVDGEKSDCPVCGKPFVFNYDVVVINPAGLAQDANDRNYKHLRDVLNVSHTKKVKKRKRKEPKDAASKKVKV